jgi:hypothetical protein
MECRLTYSVPFIAADAANVYFAAYREGLIEEARASGAYTIKVSVRFLVKLRTLPKPYGRHHAVWHNRAHRP